MNGLTGWIVAVVLQCGTGAGVAGGWEGANLLRQAEADALRAGLEVSASDERWMHERVTLGSDQQARAAELYQLNEDLQRGRVEIGALRDDLRRPKGDYRRARSEEADLLSLLLGTVIGMIIAFGLISACGTGDSFGLTAGIVESLSTTEQGHIVACPSILGYSFLNNRVRRVIAELEILSQRLLIARMRVSG